MTAEELEKARRAQTAYHKEWRARNREKNRDAARRWRAANKDKVREYNLRYWARRADREAVERKEAQHGNTEH